MFISIGQVSKLAGVSKSTLRRWEKDKYLLPDYRTKGKHRRYLYNKIMNFLGLSKDKSEKEVFIYARVSASKQKEDLKRQIDSLENYAENNNWRITGIYKDIASGLNDGRKDLLKMISDIPTKLPDLVLCTYKDRIARFGTRLLEQFCSIYDIKLMETQIKEISEEEKLAHSIIAILTSFSGKLYRSRRGRIKEIPALT
jgi:predicted site-specific integrase-resolvase